MLIEVQRSHKFSPAQAERLAELLYGLHVTARPLTGEFDENFHLTAADGAQFVLKIMRTGCDRGFVDMQSAALQHLYALPVPRTIALVATNEDGRLVWLLNWLPGRLLSETKPQIPDMLRSLGRLLGRMDTALESFDHPGAHRELKWDLAQAGWIRDYLAHIADSARRAMIER